MTYGLRPIVSSMVSVCQTTPDAMARARRALGWTFSADPGLDPRIGAAVGLGSLFLTPALGLALAWRWKIEFPRRAFQAFALALACLAFDIAVVVRL